MSLFNVSEGLLSMVNVLLTNVCVLFLSRGVVRVYILEILETDGARELLHTVYYLEVYNVD